MGCIVNQLITKSCQLGSLQVFGRLVPVRGRDHQQRYRTTLCHDSRPAYGNLAFLGTVVTCNYLIFHAVHLPSPLHAAGVLHVYATVQDNIIMLQNKRYLFLFCITMPHAPEGHLRYAVWCANKARCRRKYGYAGSRGVYMNEQALDKPSSQELAALQQRARALQASVKRRKLALNMARGKPAAAQLDLAEALLELPGRGHHLAADGTDCRNYGGNQGLPELRALFAELIGAAVDNTVVAGNSSLALMYDHLVFSL